MKSVMQWRRLPARQILFLGLFEAVHSEIPIICNGPKGIDM